MRINRERILAQLESVQPGLSPREIVEQSSCFVFQEGVIATFNDEIACRCDTGVKITGAVQAAPLLSLLRKLHDVDVEISAGEGELLVSGKKGRAGIRMEAKITLPINNVETPKKWKTLPEEFSEAVFIVQACCGTDDQKFVSTCVHVHPKWLEACDNFQMSRYRLATGIREPVLVRGSSIKHITALGMTEISETETWIHFRNPVGLIFSCRRFEGDYPNLTKLLKITGEPTTLPKGLGEAVDRAQVFSEENVDKNQVLVEIRKGKLRIRSEGTSGWYTEPRKLKYNGPPMKFMISPKLLIELSKRHNECEISQEQLRVDGGKYIYVTSLDTDEQRPSEAKEDTEDEEE